MQDKRRHKRFKLDILEINGKLILAQKSEILDISLGGVALKTDRRLNVGKEYLIKLDYKGKSIDVKGVIVRCELSNIEERNGEGVVIYAAGMMFKDPSSDMIADFINSIELDKKSTELATTDRRHCVRFTITTPFEKILSFPAQFKVKVISQSGMLIQTDQPMELESTTPMGLTLQEADKPINFIGRVASCQKKENGGQSHYEIGVEFKDLTDSDKTLLATFTDYLAALASGTGAKGAGNCPA
ncbi:MAG TPA: PilZ domain-containing protein [Nitrospirota bacterium]|nr:PilZ domain-containing protein [Nitrospirota bacterium]